MTQMGGEGAQWFGLAPFTDDRHFVQNLGDGTFHHSGSLAIRAAVAAGVTMTYKLLYNDAVAMTGGQRAEGRLDVPGAHPAGWRLEGVRRVVVTTPEPRDATGASGSPRSPTVRHRDDLAGRRAGARRGRRGHRADPRRPLRRRGAAAAQARQAARRRPSGSWINERVCEGCGDCGEKSTCLSVQPVETEFGRKTRIHQASCNSDLSCLKGDCPSFLLVDARHAGAARARARAAGGAARARRRGSRRRRRCCGCPASAAPAW